jgi:repressor LexA
MPHVTIQDPKIDDLIALGLTTRQAEVYLFLLRQTCENGYQPSYRDTMNASGFISPRAINCHLEALARKGWVGSYGGRSRAISFLRNPDGSPFRGFMPRPEDD